MLELIISCMYRSTSSMGCHWYQNRIQFWHKRRPINHCISNKHIFTFNLVTYRIFWIINTSRWQTAYYIGGSPVIITLFFSHNWLIIIVNTISYSMHIFIVTEITRQYMQALFIIQLFLFSLLIVLKQC